MKLRELLVDVEVAEIVGDAGVEIAGLSYDSRTVEPGTLFFCVPGQRSDGHEFGAGAVERGAAALVVERLLDVGATQVRVADARAAMAPIAVRFWGDPTAKLDVAGVTGTNGKTTTAFLIRHLLESQGTRTGLLGTVKRIVGGVEEEVERTTPEAIDLQRTFRRMLEGGDAACAMEVSSHALALERSAGVRFAVAVFTNLTQDHLDFHADMEEYFLAKRGLFTTSLAQDRGGATSTMPMGHGWPPSCGTRGSPRSSPSPPAGPTRPTSAPRRSPSTPPGLASCVSARMARPRCGCRCPATSTWRTRWRRSAPATRWACRPRRPPVPWRAPT